MLAVSAVDALCERSSGRRRDGDVLVAMRRHLVVWTYISAARQCGFVIPHFGFRARARSEGQQRWVVPQLGGCVIGPGDPALIQIRGCQCGCLLRMAAPFHDPIAPGHCSTVWISQDRIGASAERTSGFVVRQLIQAKQAPVARSWRQAAAPGYSGCGLSPTLTGRPVGVRTPKGGTGSGFPRPLGVVKS